MSKLYNTRANPGDLVERNYPLRIQHCSVGLVHSRDTNGYLSIMWGSKMEHMWDDGDLDVISTIESNHTCD